MASIRTYDDSTFRNRFYLVMLCLYALSLLLAGFVFPHSPSRYEVFGFSQLHHLGAGLTSISFGVILFVAFFYKKHAVRIRLDLPRSNLSILLISGICIIIFFLLRNNFINQDGEAFAVKIPRDVLLQGAHVTHDEMWELYLHSRFWFYTSIYFGWSVHFSYQVLSSIAGGISVYILIRYCQRLLPAKSLGLLLIIVSGGYMQLFFGDVENYTLTATLILSYFYASHEYLTGQKPLAFPSSILALAMTFHLLAGFLLPSLAVLYLFARHKRQFKAIWTSLAIFAAIFAFTLLFFHAHHLPIQDLYFKSHAFGHGGHIFSMLARPSWQYYVSLINLFMLLAPASLLVLPFLITRQIAWTAVNIHLGIASLSMIAYMCAWHATLGVYNDWNLFANAAIPVTLFSGYNVLNTDDAHEATALLIPIVALFFLHSYSWIISNHFYGI